MVFFIVLAGLFIIAGFGLYLAQGKISDFEISSVQVGKVIVVLCISGGYALTLGNVVTIQGLEATINYVEWGYYFLISIFAIGFASLFFGSKLAQDEEKTQ